jgi:hypothetical protein
MFEIELPKYKGRIFKPYDWFGWLASLVGIGLMAIIVRDDSIEWYQKCWVMGAVGFCTLEYFWRVAQGRVYKYIYYDTIIHNMYQIKIGENTYYICAESIEELELYLDVHYPNVSENYEVISENAVESWIKKENFV